jgi:hypothetical protein
MKYIYGNPNKAHSWKNVASIFAAHDSLNSAQTSSLPLVQFWCPSRKNYEGEKKGNDAIDLLKRCFEESYNGKEFQRAQLCFEYSVPVYKGSGLGKASMTDLMIMTAEKAIAVEAKWKECDERYPTIDDWFKERLGEGAKQTNLDGVLEGWIQYINDYLEKKGFGKKAVTVNDGDYSTIPYQLLHRIASACAVAAEKEAAVIYQLFYSSDSDENITKDNDWVNITCEKVNHFATKLQKGYEALFKNIERPVPIQFCIMGTKVVKGESFDDAVQKCKMCQKPYDWNELFLEMQQGKEIYKFPIESKRFPHNSKEL